MAKNVNLCQSVHLNKELGSLYAGTVPANKEYIAGTVPANQKLSAGTVPANKEYAVGTLQR